MKNKHTVLASLMFVRQTMIRAFSCQTIFQKSAIVVSFGPIENNNVQKKVVTDQKKWQHFLVLRIITLCCYILFLSKYILFIKFREININLNEIISNILFNLKWKNNYIIMYLAIKQLWSTYFNVVLALNQYHNVTCIPTSMQLALMQSDSDVYVLRTTRE